MVSISRYASVGGGPTCVNLGRINSWCEHALRRTNKCLLAMRKNLTHVMLQGRDAFSPKSCHGVNRHMSGAPANYQACGSV